MNILITGFEPFQGEKTNSSALLLNELSSEFGLNQKKIKTLLLPVVYQKAWLCLEQKLKTEPFDFILMLGQAGERSKISLERVALNLIDSEIPDEEGIQIFETPIETAQPKAIFNELPLREWLSKLNQNNNFEISTTAGTFVCNLVYFQYLLWQQKSKKKNQGLFVHVPKENSLMKVSQMKTSILELINLINADFYSTKI